MGTRRQAVHDGPVSTVERIVDSYDLIVMNDVSSVGVHHVVDLDEIDAPLGVLAVDRVVPSLASLCVASDAPHVIIPRTRVVRVSSVLGRIARIEDGRVGRECVPWDSAHQVNAEAHPQSVNLVCDR